LITKQHRQEGLSRALVQAIAASAGVNISQSGHDYGFDGTFHTVETRNGRYVETGFPVTYQLKATTVWSFDADHMVYDLEAKTYNDLVQRDPAAIGAILLVLRIPENEPDWASYEEGRAELRHCLYWTRLTGEPTENSATKRIRIPRSNLLTVESLNTILNDEKDRRRGIGT